jgi:hypothetical protein
MENVRRRRRRRNRDVKTPSIRNGDFDRRIFRLLATYKYLTNRLIAGLLDKSEGYVADRTLLLFEARFLKQYVDPDRKMPPGTPNYYMLDEPGAEELVSEGTDPDEIINIYRQTTEEKSPNFVHDFAACNLMASIEIEAKALGYEYIPWHAILARVGHSTSTEMPCQIRYRFPDGHMENKNTSARPDGLFGLRQPSGKVSFFAVEVEKGNPIKPNKNLARGSILNKVLAYRDIRKTRQFHKVLGIGNLRTIIFAKSLVRANTMVLSTEEIIGPTNQFLFTHADYSKTTPYTLLLGRQFLRAGMEPTALIPKQKEPPA